MKRAFLDAHFDDVDPANLTDKQVELMRWLDDGDNWMVNSDSQRCMCEIRHEDGCVGVVRITDAMTPN